MFTIPELDQILSGLLLTVVPLVALLPILWAFDSALFVRTARSPLTWLYTLLAVAGLAVVLGSFLQRYSAEQIIDNARVWTSAVHMLLIFDLLILLPRLLTVIWPRGGAVAVAAFREGYRQPLFWGITLLGGLLINISVFMPYFTFGDDFKMMKQIGFDITMLLPMLFGILAASISIHEEIEGRTAITLISKPVTRRQFLLGKFVGICMAAAAMTLLLGWLLNWALYVQVEVVLYQFDERADPLADQATAAITPTLTWLFPAGQGESVARGIADWGGDTIANSFGQLLGFGQVMVLIGIASALATRMPFVGNLTVCLVIFFLGNLAPVLVDATKSLAQNEDAGSAILLVGFLAQLFDAILPSLQFFQMGPAIIRDAPIDLGNFIGYVFRVFGYALVYSVITLLVGLILFEDRDLA